VFLEHEGAKPHLKRTLRPRVSLSENFLVQAGDVVASLVPALEKIGFVGITAGYAVAWILVFVVNKQDRGFPLLSKMRARAGVVGISGLRC
jgi:hypothetical protein